jgi:hypothetical protein
MCATPPDAAAAFHANYPGEETVFVGRDYVSKASRRQAFGRRVASMADLLQVSLLPERVLRGDGS